MTYIVGNWKMHGVPDVWRALADGSVRLGRENPNVKTILCVPSAALSCVREVIANDPIFMGAQSIHGADAGAYTGETSAEMVTALGATYTLVGHSEYRLSHPSERYAPHLVQAQKNGLIPIVCIGEDYAQYQKGRTEEILRAQLEDALEKWDMSVDLLIAYEPRWSISATVEAGVVADHQTVKPVFEFLATYLKDKGCSATLLYGGSVSGKKCK